MLKKIFYSKLFDGDIYRPYLKVYFYNPVTKQTKAQLALIDSGADSTLIPFSLGNAIGFKPAIDIELGVSNGVAGSLTTVSRECVVALVSSDNKKLFTFKTTITWAHPNQEKVDFLNILYSAYNSSSPSQQDIIKKTTTSITNNFETNVLLGRNFFKNFDFIQFIEKERGDASKFIYKIREDRIDKTFTLS